MVTIIFYTICEKIKVRTKVPLSDNVFVSIFLHTFAFGLKVGVIDIEMSDSRLEPPTSPFQWKQAAPCNMNNAILIS